MHIPFLANSSVTKTRGVDFHFPGYELTNIFQDQHISNLCFLMNFCAHLPAIRAEGKAALRGTMHLENKDCGSCCCVIPLLAQGLRVHCCPGCTQSGDGRAKEGTGDCCAGDRATPGQQPQRGDARAERVQWPQTGSATVQSPEK